MDGRKLSLALIKCALFLFFLEFFLQTGPLFTKAYQDFENRSLLKPGRQTVIVCVGDSMTAVGGEESYPSQLQAVLNASQGGINFVVLNKGVGGASLRSISEHLEDYLKTYRPDLVVLMAGLNAADQRFDPWNNDADEEDVRRPFSPSLKIWQLYHSLDNQLEQSFREILSRYNPKPKDRPDALSDEIQSYAAQAKQSPSAGHYTRLGMLYQKAGRYQEALESFRTAVGMDPRHYAAWKLIAQIHLANEQPENAIAPLFRLAETCPRDDNDLFSFAYSHLVDCFRATDRKSQFDTIYRHAVDTHPQNNWGYEEWGKFLWDDRRYPEAVQVFRRQLSANPKAINAHQKIAAYIRMRDGTEAAIAYLKKAAQENRKDKDLHLFLVNMLIENERYTEAEKILEKSLVTSYADMESVLHTTFTDGFHYQAYMLLADLYTKNGKSDYARLIYGSLNRFKDTEAALYHKIREMTRRYRIPLVVAQYPQIEVEALYKSLRPLADVIVVDNKKSFGNVLSEENYYEYFVDNQGGNFGHCTAKGNRLLAENIALEILRYLKIQ